LDGYRITPLRAKHDPKEECLIYAIEGGNRTILYANDTGFFPGDTWDYLASSKLRFDLASLDCTTMRFPEGSNHMGLPDTVELRRELISRGTASEKTIFVLNHFSHNGGWSYAELQDAAEKQNFLVSHDGMEISV
jgi:phosphoribosyl 1,2-cyclic phosphate phosphodiesterase